MELPRECVFCLCFLLPSKNRFSSRGGCSAGKNEGDPWYELVVVLYTRYSAVILSVRGYSTVPYRFWFLWTIEQYNHTARVCKTIKSFRVHILHLLRFFVIRTIKQKQKHLFWLHTPSTLEAKSLRVHQKFASLVKAPLGLSPRTSIPLSKSFRVHF